MTRKTPEGRLETVLVVEDDPTLRLGLQKTLRSAGFRVEVARTGAEGLSMALAARPDLVLLDVMLPGMNGFEICEELRRHDADLPILMVTAKAEEQDRVRGLRLGADDYIVKPFGVSELLARVDAALRRRRLGDAERAVVQFAEVVVDLSQASPFARALARYFPVPESSPRAITIRVLTFGGSREVSERLRTFAIGPAIRALRQEACPRCDDQVVINHMSSGTDGWVQIAAARPRLGSSLAVFYFDLGNQRIPARYDADLPLPTADIVARLEKGEGLIAARERAGAPPAILIAAPRRAHLPAVEAALAAMTELPAAPVSVPLPGQIEPAEIQAVVRGSFGRYRVCYEELLAGSPAAAGSVPLTFAILGDGAVADAAVDTARSTLRDATLERCMVAATSALRFPGIGQKTKVVYPIELSPGG
ncbi:response regulator [Sorangium sp. So ce429]